MNMSNKSSYLISKYYNKPRIQIQNNCIIGIENIEIVSEGLPIFMNKMKYIKKNKVRK
jgi:hypothetical protein